MAWTLERGVAHLANLSHVGIAVTNTQQAVRFLSSVWNIGAPESFDYWPTSEEMISGEPFGVQLTFIKFGPLTLELLEPLDEKSIWAKFIAEKGEGIHHIALGVSNYEQMVDIFSAQGHSLLVAAVFQGCRWCYFDTSPSGVVVEFREEYGRQS